MKFQNLKFGETPNPGARLFTPMTVAGRSSSTEVLLFYAIATGSFVEQTGSVRLPLRFALRMNVDATGDWLAPRQPAPVVFDMTASYLQSHNQMASGRPTELHDSRWTQALPGSEPSPKPE